MKDLIVVLGGGESGVGSAVLAQKEGFEVWLSDSGTIKQKYKDMLEARQIPYEEGGHNVDKILSAKEVIKSPGIPNTAPIIQQITAVNIPIISEIEFAGRYTNAKMICITGSNGKTTTTLLTYHIFKECGVDVGLAGNVGNSLALQVAETPHDCYVVELSSFQLEGMHQFKANVAIITNITPDHLDRYDFKMQNYVDAKMRILQNQTKEDAFIYWANDPILQAEISKRTIVAKQYPFAIDFKEGLAAYMQEHELIVSTEKDDEFRLKEELMTLSGLHNMYNSMASAITANLSHLQKEKVQKAFSNFPGVEHRMEKVAKVKGVLYINDSKATNVNSCWYALQSVKTPIVLILGGKDKGNDYTEIEELVSKKVKHIICLGKDNTKLHSFFGEWKPLSDAHSMHEAIEIAYRVAEKGDTVLLSPCCASFDLFTSYEDRGKQFKEEVKKL